MEVNHVPAVYNLTLTADEMLVISTLAGESTVESVRHHAKATRYAVSVNFELADFLDKLANIVPFEAN